MDPYTIAFIAKSGFDLFSAYSQGEAAKKRQELKNQLAEFNARAMENDANETIKLGLVKKAHYLRKAQQVASSQNVAYAAAGVDTSFGSAKQVQEESRLMGMLNAKDIEDAAHTQALGYKAKALEFRFNSQMESAATDQAVNNFMMSTIIKTGADIGLNWNKMSFGGGPKPETETKNPYELNLNSQLNYGGEFDLSSFGMGGNTRNAGVRLGY